MAACSSKFTEKHKNILRSALKKYGTQNSISTLIELEGLVVGMLSRPSNVGLSEEFELIWGVDDEDQPSWDDQKEVEGFIESLFTLHNCNNDRIRGMRYKPKILDSKDYYKLWCRGFIKGLGPQYLEQPLEEALGYAALIIMVLAESHSIDTPMLSADQDFQEFLTDAKKISIVKFGNVIQLFYKYYNKGPSNLPEAHAKTPKRNDPCPCGSGKKFKHCCLH